MQVTNLVQVLQDQMQAHESHVQIAEQDHKDLVPVAGPVQVPEDLVQDLGLDHAQDRDQLRVQDLGQD